MSVSHWMRMFGIYIFSAEVGWKFQILLSHTFEEFSSWYTRPRGPSWRWWIIIFIIYCTIILTLVVSLIISRCSPVLIGIYFSSSLIIIILHDFWWRFGRSLVPPQYLSQHWSIWLLTLSTVHKSSDYFPGFIRISFVNGFKKTRRIRRGTEVRRVMYSNAALTKYFLRVSMNYRDTTQFGSVGSNLVWISHLVVLHPVRNLNIRRCGSLLTWVVLQCGWIFLAVNRHWCY